MRIVYLTNRDTPSDLNPVSLEVHAQSPADVVVAESVSQLLDLPLANPRHNHDGAWQLRIDGERRTVLRADGAELAIDFTSGNTARHAQEKNLINQPFAKAVGISSFEQRRQRFPVVVDATAGLGQDAWLIASLGCPVTLIEQSRVLAHLLEYALTSAQANPQYAPVADRMSVVCANAITWFADNDSSPDVVYLDPMYPARRKSAKVKKGMQFLHELVGPQQAESSLLAAALRSATHRVVVKRPASAAPLQGTKNFTGQVTTVSSPNTRYDVYHCH